LLDDEEPAPECSTTPRNDSVVQPPVLQPQHSKPDLEVVCNVCDVHFYSLDTVSDHFDDESHKQLYSLLLKSVKSQHAISGVLASAAPASEPASK
jgi:hypothetical protein